jgi:hypothetical protein
MFLYILFYLFMHKNVLAMDTYTLTYLKKQLKIKSRNISTFILRFIIQKNFTMGVAIIIQSGFCKESYVFVKH